MGKEETTPKETIVKRVTFRLNMKQIEDLKSLSSVTRIKQADFMREGINMLLDKYRKELRKVPKNPKNPKERG